MNSSTGNYSVIAINPHAYAISVEDSLSSVVFPNTYGLIVMFGLLGGLTVFKVVIQVIKRRQERKLDKDFPRKQPDPRTPATGI